jgi:hypothetical protein
MAEKEVDALLERMSKIATAVNAFKSETVQQAALAALVAAFEAGSAVRKPAAPPRDDSDVSGEPADQDGGDEANASGKSGKVRRRAKTSSGASSSVIVPVRDLDLRPNGVESFDEFIAKKRPRDNQEKYAVAVYYLEQIAAINPVTLGHLAAVFKQTAGWRESGNIASGVPVTAKRKNTINPVDLNDLKTTPHGRNFVEHDIPHMAAKKA